MKIMNAIKSTIGKKNNNRSNVSFQLQLMYAQTISDIDEIVVSESIARNSLTEALTKISGSRTLMR